MSIPLRHTYDEVLIAPQYSTIRSRKDIDISVRIGPLTLRVPVVNGNMQTVVSEQFCSSLAAHGGLSYIHQFVSIEEEVALLQKLQAKGVITAVASGIAGDAHDRITALHKAGAEIFILDTPHAHTIYAKDIITWFRTHIGKKTLIVGNVATKEGAAYLIKAGADGVKVGIGPGAACTTRITAGVGIPQLSAVMECATVTRKLSKILIADGGITSAGSFAKAMAAGATCVMVGSMFAGTDEAPSELITIEGVPYKRYFGSSSRTARSLRESHDKKFHSSGNFFEGDAGVTIYRGALADLMGSFEDGLRSAMSYTGAGSIAEYHQKATFVLCTSVGIGENGAHGIIKR
ncbi:MAG: guanosine monophosphate reductase [bacterium]